MTIQHEQPEIDRIMAKTVTVAGLMYGIAAYPVIPNSQYLFNSDVVGVDQDTLETCSFKMSTTFKTDSQGNATPVGDPQIFYTNRDSSLNSTGIHAEVSGGINIALLVIGQPGRTILWAWSASILRNTFTYIS